MEPVVLGEIVVCECYCLLVECNCFSELYNLIYVVFLALRVNVSSQLRKTSGTWLFASGLANVPGSTHG